jgi:hypothetical protein
LDKKQTMSNYHIVHDFEKSTRTVVYKDFYGKPMSTLLEEDIKLKHPEPTEEEFNLIDDGSNVEGKEVRESRTYPGEKLFEFEKPNLLNRLWPSSGPLKTKGEIRHLRFKRLAIASFFFSLVFMNYKKSLKL